MVLRSDFLVALLIALGAHGALLVFAPPFGGGGAGDGGQSEMSLRPASAAIRAEVAKWETQPEVVQDAAVLAMPTLTDATPIRPATDTAPAQTETLALPRVESGVAPALPLVALERPTAPEVADTAPDLARTAPPIAPQTVPALPDVDIARDTVVTPDPLPGLAPEMAERPPMRPDRQPAPAQVASGSGERAKAGSGVKEVAAGPSAAEKSRAQARWAATIQARIARQQRYPRGTRASGRVRVQMTVLASGALGNVGLLASSGEVALDRAAILAVERAAPFPPAPEELSEDWYAVTQWISFERR